MRSAWFLAPDHLCGQFAQRLDVCEGLPVCRGHWALRALVFERERISKTVLPSLTDQNLRDAGVVKLGDRHKILRMAADIPSSLTVQ